MACNFDSTLGTPSIEEQLKDYCLSLVDTGMCAVQEDQIMFTTTEDQAQIFYDLRCSDIEYSSSVGAFDYYFYDDVLIVVSKLSPN